MAERGQQDQKAFESAGKIGLAVSMGMIVIGGSAARVSMARAISLVTGIADLQTHRLAIQLGALNCKKQEPYEVLAKAIRKVYAGEAWIDCSMVAGIISTFSRGSEPNPETERAALLSERERQVISSLGRGLKNKEIAEHLCISDTTVRHHLTAIFSKLQVADRLELLIFAYRNGLVEQSR